MNAAKCGHGSVPLTRQTGMTIAIKVINGDGGVCVCVGMWYGNPKIRSKYKMKEGDGKLTDIKHDDEVEKDLRVLFDRNNTSDAQ